MHQAAADGHPPPPPPKTHLKLGLRGQGNINCLYWYVGLKISGSGEISIGCNPIAWYATLVYLVGKMIPALLLVIVEYLLFAYRVYRALVPFKEKNHRIR